MARRRATRATASHNAALSTHIPVRGALGCCAGPQFCLVHRLVIALQMTAFGRGGWLGRMSQSGRLPPMAIRVSRHSSERPLWSAATGWRRPTTVVHDLPLSGISISAGLECPYAVITHEKVIDTNPADDAHAARGLILATIFRRRPPTALGTEDSKLSSGLADAPTIHALHRRNHCWFRPPLRFSRS